VPRLFRARARQLAKVAQSLEAHLGRKLAQRKMANGLDISMGELKEALLDTGDRNLVSPHEIQKQNLENLLIKGLSQVERLIKPPKL
jgi:DNA-directed RNA polymerase specialized sigma subunit